ncbi:MAG: HAMP domain-containing sensor histidine kinase, partial [Bdellovibrionota bacterium]
MPIVHPEMAGVSAEFAAKVSDQAEMEIRRRSVVRIPAYFILFVVILLVTPVMRRNPVPTSIFGGLIFSISLYRAFLCLRWNKFFPTQQRLWSFLSTSGIYLIAAVCGCAAALCIAGYELGWTSFCVMLITFAICAGEMSGLAPAYHLLARYLGLMLLPCAVVNFVVVGGLRGNALGLFFLSYFALLILQGRILSKEYWQNLRESARLMAMLDAMPGMLAWVSSDLKYLGVNHNMAKARNLMPDDFVGKNIGFLNTQSYLLSFCTALFKSENQVRAMESKRSIDGKDRKYYLFGQKYNMGTEAIVLGLDMTENYEAMEEIVKERAHRFFSAKFANFGQVASRVIESLYGEMSRYIGGNPSSGAKLKDITRVLSLMVPSNTDKDPVGVGSQEILPKEILKDCQLAVGEFASIHGIQFSVRDGMSGGRFIHGQRRQIFEVMLILLNNAFDAVEVSDRKRVSLELDCTDSECIFSIFDTGSGVPVEVRERLFEPLFTTKPPGKATGVGLSAAKELV